MSSSEARIGTLPEIQAYPGQPIAELALGDPAYPAGLASLPDPPKRLCMIGNAQLLDQPALAIVGSRKASPYGLLCANRFARRAAWHGLVVVSGGAVGCDQAAHQGALDVESPTIVVLGCGADVVYPQKARPLFERILAHGGLLLSELPWHAPPARWAFIKRNRLIAGLASATLIVEAGLPSGTFSTADAALNLGTELLVIPGSILSKQSAGSNHLIAQGAWPIIDDASFDAAVKDIYLSLPGTRQNRRAEGDSLKVAAADGIGRLPTVLDDMQLLAIVDDERPETQSATIQPPTSQPALSQAAPGKPAQTQLPTSQPAPDPLSNLIELLAVTPSRPDELIGVCGGDIVEVIRCLSNLEFTGRVVRLGDGRFALSQSGWSLRD